jgi:hypothetical protein
MKKHLCYECGQEMEKDADPDQKHCFVCLEAMEDELNEPSDNPLREIEKENAVAYYEGNEFNNL